MSVENLTACNFLEGWRSAGNEIWFNFGDGSGRSMPGAFRGAYLNATSTLLRHRQAAASYGIFSSNTRGPGMFTHTYASNMNDSSYYIGACTDCNQVITDSQAQYSALGYSGTNSGGHLIIEKSEWDHNQSGIVDQQPEQRRHPLAPATASAPAADDGTARARSSATTSSTTTTTRTCPAPAAPPSDPSAPGSSSPAAASTLSTGNRVVNNGSWGILLVPFPDTGHATADRPLRGREHQRPHSPGCYYDDWANTVSSNTFTHNGFFGNPTMATPGRSASSTRQATAGSATPTPPARRSRARRPTSRRRTAPAAGRTRARGRRARWRSK